MNIDAEMGKYRASIMEKLKQISTSDKESVIQALEEMGFSYYDASNLVNSYVYNTATGIELSMAWDTAAKEVSGRFVNYEKDVKPSNERFIESGTRFKKIISKMSFIMAVNGMESDEITDELLEKMLEAGIEVSQITRRGIQIAYKYYKENNEKARLLDALRKKFRSAEQGIEELTGIRRRYNINVKKVVEKNAELREYFRQRIMNAEEQFQLALSYIETLKDALEESQKEGFLRRAIRRFTRKSNIPKKPKRLVGTLLTPSERLGLGLRVERTDTVVSNENRHGVQDIVNKTTSNVVDPNIVVEPEV